MEQPQSFNQKQRETFERLLEEARNREEVELDSKDDVTSRAETDTVAKLAEEKGALALIAKVRKLRKELADAESALSGLGFDGDKDGISLKWKAPKNLQQAVEAAKRLVSFDIADQLITRRTPMESQHESRRTTSNLA